MNKTFFFTILLILVYNLNLHGETSLFKASDNVYIDTINQIIEAHGNTEFKTPTFYITSKEMFVHYISLVNLTDNLKKQSLDNFKRIEAKGDVNVAFSDSIMYGSQLIYDVNLGILVLKANNSALFYENKQVKITAKDRFEFNENDNTIVARGKPNIDIFAKESSVMLYNINANLIYGKLNDTRNNINYIEAFNNIVIVQNNSKNIITGDYAYYNSLNSIVTIEDNVSVTAQGSVVKGCKLIVDLNTNISELIPCSSKGTLSTTINMNERK